MQFRDAVDADAPALATLDPLGLPRRQQSRRLDHRGRPARRPAGGRRGGARRDRRSGVGAAGAPRRRRHGPRVLRARAPAGRRRLLRDVRCPPRRHGAARVATCSPRPNGRRWALVGDRDGIDRDRATRRTHRVLRAARIRAHGRDQAVPVRRPALRRPTPRRPALRGAAQAAVRTAGPDSRVRRSRTATGRRPPHRQHESSRSISPPWPGSSRPMSLTPRSRLIIDSPRSPRVAATMTAAP